MMVLFVVVEKRVKHPLLPLRVATERNRAAAFLASFLADAVLIGGILFINYYIQIVLGFAPFIAGIASLGAGLGMVFVPMQNLALFGVDDHDAGVASALVNATQQIGGSLGIALFSTIAAAATATAAGSKLEALSAGYSSVFLWAAGVAILITPLAMLLITITKKTFSGSGEQPIHLG